MEGRFFASKYPERKQKHLYIYVIICVWGYEVTYIDPQKKNRRLLIESTLFFKSWLNRVPIVSGSNLFDSFGPTFDSSATSLIFHAPKNVSVSMADRMIRMWVFPCCQVFVATDYLSNLRITLFTRWFLKTTHLEEVWGTVDFFVATKMPCPKKER